MTEIVEEVVVAITDWGTEAADETAEETSSGGGTIEGSDDVGVIMTASMGLMLFPALALPRAALLFGKLSWEPPPLFLPAGPLFRGRGEHLSPEA